MSSLVIWLEDINSQFRDQLASDFDTLILFGNGYFYAAKIERTILRIIAIYATVVLATFILVYIPSYVSYRFGIYSNW